MTDPIEAKIQELVPDVMERPDCDCPYCDDEHGGELPSITLAVVLRAIDKTYQFSSSNEHFVGKFELINPRYINDSFKHDAYWNLEHDNYDAQSQETKDFIGSLLNI